MYRFRIERFWPGLLVIGRTCLCLALCCMLNSRDVFGDDSDNNDKIWQELEPGLGFAEFDSPELHTTRIIVLRFSPEQFDFTLHSISEEGGSPKTLAEWVDKHGLVAAINASMYLPDAKTSTGYMRNGDHVNNGRISARFGVFFVSGPLVPGLPSAALIDRDADPWQEKIKNYKIVVQNYRMINADRRILWSAGGPLYAISAVGQGVDGSIYFIHCREAVEAYILCQALLALPLNLRSLMYVEGGAQAGLALRAKSFSRDWFAPHMAGLLITGKIHAVLPNIIGVKRKAESKVEEQSNQDTPKAPSEVPPEQGINPQSKDSVVPQDTLPDKDVKGPQEGESSVLKKDENEPEAATPQKKPGQNRWTLKANH